VTAEGLVLVTAERGLVHGIGIHLSGGLVPENEIVRGHEKDGVLGIDKDLGQEIDGGLVPGKGERGIDPGQIQGIGVTEFIDHAQETEDDDEAIHGRGRDETKHSLHC
jgi:hypothetical protein